MKNWSWIRLFYPDVVIPVVTAAIVALLIWKSVSP